MSGLKAERWAEGDWVHKGSQPVEHGRRKGNLRWLNKTRHPISKRTPGTLNRLYHKVNEDGIKADIEALRAELSQLNARLSELDDRSRVEGLEASIQRLESSFQKLEHSLIHHTHTGVGIEAAFVDLAVF